MKRIHDDGTLELRGKPIQQLVLDWSAASTEEVAEAVRQTFTDASVLPNATVLRELRELSESMGTTGPWHSWRSTTSGASTRPGRAGSPSTPGSVRLSPSQTFSRTTSGS